MSTTSTTSNDDAVKEIPSITLPVPDQPVPEDDSQVYAIIVKDAVKKYGYKGPPVLNNFSMNVKKGTIYSLLGSSGCGKTSVLSCIVGLKNLNSGSIYVFGFKPGTPESGIPGRRIGYMPQEIALYKAFSIKEMLKYYGTLYGMTGSEVDRQIEYLVKFLSLPPASRRIGSLSGGQQRRVSFAVSLIHSPDVLILDEPTVGVDPLLRKNIWKHLFKRVALQGTTVIITTHYTEEARGSHTVGLMRDGRLLVEDNPEALLNQYNTHILEDVVVQLCLMDSGLPLSEAESAIGMDGSSIHVESPPFVVIPVIKVEKPEKNAIPDLPPEHIKLESSSEVSVKDSFFDERSIVEQGKIVSGIFILGKKADKFTSLKRIQALTIKNVVIMLRNWIFMVFLLAIPALEIIILCMSIGHDPSGLKIALVNDDSNDPNCLMEKYPWNRGNEENYSCRFLTLIPRENVEFIEFKNIEDATNAVKEGKAWGYMHFLNGFSENLILRFKGGFGIADKALYGSLIGLRMDMSNKQIFATLQRLFQLAFDELIRHYLKSIGKSESLGLQPLAYDMSHPIYGKGDTDFREYVAPGALLGVIFFFPLCSSSISYIHDKKQGTLERAMVAGVRTYEIMIAFFITEGVVLIIQTIITFVIITVMYGIEVKGSIALAVSLTVFIGLGGVSMGFLISTYCNEEIEAVLLALAAFLPNVLVTGMLWPIQGMPLGVQYFSYVLPGTLANESLRSIISRGWGLSHVGVWPGFITTFGWIMVYWTLTILIIKYQRSRL